MDILDILISVIASTGLVTLIFKWFLQKDLEKYKNNLKQESIRFSKLYEERANVIKNMYSKLSSLELQMKSLVQPFRPSGYNVEEKRADAATKINDFITLAHEHKIFFNVHTCQLIDDILSEFKEMYNKFTILKIDDVDDDSIPQGQKTQEWVDMWSSLTQGRVSQLKSELENEFRLILGV